MPEQLGVTPPELRAVARELHAVSSRAKDIVSSWNAALGGEGAAWGDDRMGDQFANGGDGYLAQRGWVGDAIAAQTGFLDQLSEGLSGAADSFELNEQSVPRTTHPMNLPGGTESSSVSAKRG